MRISSNTIFDVNVTALNQQQYKMLQTQQQISSGRRILTPANDPAGAARALLMTQADATNTQYLTNINRTQDSVALSEGVLAGITTQVQNIQTAAVQAGNPIMSNADRKILATDLQIKLDQLTTMANTKDGVGNYLYSGFKGNTQPFVNTPTGVQYNGDDGQRLVQVSGNRQLAASDSGSEIFMRVLNGNGTFVTQPDTTSNAGAGNAGDGVITVGSLAVPPPAAAQLRNSYSINFTVAAGVTTYNVLDTTAGLPGVAISTANAYVSGQNISFNGIQFDITGTPANGDQFAIIPSSHESVFKTIADLITTLNTPVNTADPASNGKFSAGINKGLIGMDNALNSVLTARASLGSRLVELDSLKSTGADLGNQYKQTLSRLQDVDFNKAITDLTKQTTMLQAAQKSFLKVENLSMFNYM